MLEKKSQEIMELNQEIEIVELEDAWLDDAAGGDGEAPNGVCPTINFRCKPPPV